MGNYQTNRGLEQAIKANRGKGGGPSYSNQYSLNFDGIDDYVNCRNGSNLQFTTAITISAWVKPDIIDTSGGIIDKYDTGPYSGWSIWQSSAGDGKWKGTFGIEEPSNPGVGVQTEVEFLIPSTDWQHVVVTFNGTTGVLSLYHDGSPVDTDSNEAGSIIYTNLEEIIMGARSDSPATEFEGNIDEVAIWDTVLDDATIDSIFNSGAPNDLNLGESYTAGGGIDKSGDLQTWWRMGEFGTYFNGNWEIPEYTKINNFSSHCFAFDGVDDYIITTTLTDLGMAATNTMTVSCWVYFDTIALYDTVMGASSTSLPTYPDGFGFWIGSGGAGNPIQFFVNAQATWADSTPTTTNTGEWYHITGVYDGTLGSDNIKLYINGSVQSTTGALTANITGVTERIHIGRIWRDVENCNGKIDNVAIWSVALDDNTVDSIYNAGEPNNLTLAASYTSGGGLDESANLEAYWKMGNDATWLGFPFNSWSIPDASGNGNPGTGQNMDEEDKINFAPDNENQGLSDGMGEDAPSGRDTDVP